MRRRKVLGVIAAWTFALNAYRSNAANFSIPERLARIAEQEARRLAGRHRGDPILEEAIGRYATAIGLPTEYGHYSAVFVSWCIRQSGVPASAFPASKLHSEYVGHALSEDPSFAFSALDITVSRPVRGDIVEVYRGATPISLGLLRSEPGTSYAGEALICLTDGHEGLAYVEGVLPNDLSSGGGISVVRLPVDAHGYLREPSVYRYVALLRYKTSD